MPHSRRAFPLIALLATLSGGGLACGADGAPAGHAAEGQPIAVLSPPIRLAWEPDVPMHAGLWKDGQEMPALTPGALIPSGTVLADLPPGTYQVKVAPTTADKALWCSTSAWFVVPTRR